MSLTKARSRHRIEGSGENKLLRGPRRTEAHLTASPSATHFARRASGVHGAAGHGGAVSKLQKWKHGGLVAFKPGEAALRVHTAESAERIAARAKDMNALEAAVEAKLAAQREFAAGYKAEFKQGRHTPEQAHDAETYCGRYGFAHRTVQRWCERLLDEESFERERHDRLMKAWAVLEMEQAANFSSESVDWYTPAVYLEAARRCMGGIDLDPASSEQANQTVKASAYFASHQDGLKLDWWGRVFLNPPYGRTEGGGSLAAEFCNRAIEQYRAGQVTAAVLLVNSLHSQSWQRPLFDWPVCLVDHRIQFVAADGEENKSPTFQNLFVYLGKDLPSFQREFAPIGYVMQRVAE